MLSRSLSPGERNGVTFTNAPVAELVKDIRKRRGKDVWLSRGGEIVREFLKADLVDEMEIGIVPVLIGEGIPLFPSGFPQREFAVVESKSYSKGLVVLRYNRVRAKGKPKPRRAA